MKTVSYCLILLSILAVSAGCSKRTEAEVKPLSSKIKGPLGDYVKVVDGDYKITKSDKIGADWEITFKLKLQKSPEPYFIYELEKNYSQLELTGALTDASGKPIGGFQEFSLGDSWSSGDQSQKVLALLKETPGAEEWITLPIEVDFNSEYDKELPESIAKVTFRSEIKQKEATPESAQKPDDMDGIYDGAETADYSSGGGDCGEALREYESFVDEYISFIERAANGDYSAMSKAPSLMSKAERAGQKLQNMGQAQLGDDCWENYVRIQQKLAGAAARMTKNMPKNMENMQQQMEDFQNMIPD